jgi:hypothetical protein
MSEAAETETGSPVGGGGSRVIGLVAAIVAPTTLITGLARYFGHRRERAFASFFGIDVSALDFSTTDYVLRSVDALVRSGEKFFLTPTPVNPNSSWDPPLDSVSVIPNDGDVRIELTRGADYATNRVEGTAKRQLAFTC